MQRCVLAPPVCCGLQMQCEPTLGVLRQRLQQPRLAYPSCPLHYHKPATPVETLRRRRPRRLHHLLQLAEDAVQLALAPDER